MTDGSRLLTVVQQISPAVVLHSELAAHVLGHSFEGVQMPCE